MGETVVAEANGELHQDTAESPPKSTGSSSVPGKINGNMSSTPNSATDSVTPPAKGFGLRRWRRVKRETIKEDDSASDSSRILKRGLSNSESAKVINENLRKSVDDDDKFSASVDSRTVESVSSVRSHDLEILETAAGFSVGLNSDDSDERSNREGLRHEKERDLRAKSFRGKSSVQRRKGAPLEIVKKIREDQAMKPEKEDSHSSVESDLRVCTAGSNENSQTSVNYNGAPDHESEEVVDQTSRGDLEKDESGKDDVEEREIEASTAHEEDPFLEPLNLLHVAQETLEKEIVNLEEISKELTSWPGESLEVREKEMEESEALFRKSIEGEVTCLILSAALREQRKGGERKEVVVLEKELEQITESCRGLERMEEVLRLQNGVCKISFYWLVQLVLLILAMVVVAVQIFFSAAGDGGAVPT